MTISRSSAVTAWRVGDWLGTGPQVWMDLQGKWDLSHGRKTGKSTSGRGVRATKPDGTLDRYFASPSSASDRRAGRAGVR